MILWVLMIAAQLHAGGPFIAFTSQDACREAASRVPVPARCISFAADVPDGKEE